MKWNERGLTLVELLAALALVSIIAVAASTALVIGLKHSNAETGKKDIQQETNIAMNQLTNLHRRSDSFSMSFLDGTFRVETCSGGTCTTETILDGFDFTGTVVDGQKLEPDTAFCDGATEPCTPPLKLSPFTLTVGNEAGTNYETPDIHPKAAHTTIHLALKSAATDRVQTVTTTLTRLLTNKP